MPRIRTIKPEFFTDSDIGSLPPLVRLLFIGMWTEADKAGRLKDNPGTLKARCLPFDNLDISKALKALEEGGFIIRYVVGKEKYIQIRTWDVHQRPHHTERESTIPEVSNGEITVNAPLINGMNEASPPLLNGEKKDSRKREPSFPFLSLPFLSGFKSDPEFEAVWEKWVVHMKEVKKKPTPTQMDQLVSDLNAMGPERAKAAIRHSISKGWKSIHEPSPQPTLPGMNGNGQKRELTWEERHAARKEQYGS